MGFQNLLTSMQALTSTNDSMSILFFSAIILAFSQASALEFSNFSWIFLVNPTKLSVATRTQLLQSALANWNPTREINRIISTFIFKSVFKTELNAVFFIYLQWVGHHRTEFDSLSNQCNFNFWINFLIKLWVKMNFAGTSKLNDTNLMIQREFLYKYVQFHQRVRVQHTLRV